MTTGQSADRVLGLLHGIMWALALLPLAIALIALPMMPDVIPMHYDVHGDVDRWGGKYESLILPALCIGFAVCWRIMEIAVARSAERRRGDVPDWEVSLVELSPRGTSRVFVMGGVCALAVFDVLQAFLTYTAFARTEHLDSLRIGIDQIVAVAVGLMLIVLGNVMPQVQRNGIVGVRVPGAYASPESWRKCQRMGGILFIVGGLVMVVCGSLSRGAAAIAMLAVSVAVTLIMLAYGRYAGRRYGHGEEPRGTA